MSRERAGSHKVSKTKVTSTIQKRHKAASLHALNNWWARQLGGHVPEGSVRDILMERGIILQSLPGGMYTYVRSGS